MTVSSYLEAFLTVYGWDMYYVFYLLFASIGLFLYPYLRILNDVYIGYVSGGFYINGYFGVFFSISTYNVYRFKLNSR